MSIGQKNTVALEKLLHKYQASFYDNFKPVADGYAILSREDHSQQEINVWDATLEWTEDKRDIEYNLDPQCVVVPRHTSSICHFNVDEEPFDCIAGGYEGTFILEFGARKTDNRIWVNHMSIAGMSRTHNGVYQVDMVFEQQHVFVQTDQDVKAILFFKDTLDQLDAIDLD